MAELKAIDKVHNIAVAGASIWDHTNESKVEYFGATNAGGLLQISGSFPTKVRVIADGFVPVDLPNVSKNDLLIPLTRLHPGAYSGFLPDARVTTWRSEDVDEILQFTSVGLYRRVQSMHDLERTALQQYLLTERAEWSELKTRSNAYPTLDTGWTTVISFYHFRFPEPGVMLGRHHLTQKEISFRRAN